MPTDLSRYADWTTWLAEQGATDPDVRVELQAAIGEAVDQIRQRRATAEWLVNRAIRRGQHAEATHLYLGIAWTDELLARRGRP